MSTEIIYTPVPVPMDPLEVRRYLDDELNRISQAFSLLNTRVVTAVPWKAVMARIQGTATTTPTLANAYNVATAVYVGNQTEYAVYQVTLTLPVVATVQVLPVTYFLVTPVILDGNKPADTEVFFASVVIVNAATGVFRVHLSGGNVPASGKLTLVPYVLQLGDSLEVVGLFNLLGAVTDVAPSGAQMAQNLQGAIEEQ